MGFWDIILLWLVAKLVGSGGSGPRWPEPKGPTGPTGPGPTGPTGATGPTRGTTWKPYFYLQPDAGVRLGTPYDLAANWTGKGSLWTEMYNFSAGRPIAEPMQSGEKAREDVHAGHQVTNVTPAYAAVGDKLLIPWYWPEPRDQSIMPRLQVMTPADLQSLPAQSYSGKVSGDETHETI